MTTRVLPEFKLLSPQTIAEALAFADQHKSNAKFLAGGTDVLVKMKVGTMAPSILISIGSLSGMDNITYDHNHGLVMGALTTIRDIEISSVIGRVFPFLQDVAKAFANVQLLNMGTLGGNICNASPAGDMIPPLMSMNAVVTLVSTVGTRSVKLIDFFTGPGKTVIVSGELLSQITAPPLPNNHGTSFVKICRTAEDLAKVSVATVLSESDGKFKDVRISLGAVAPTVIRVFEVEKFLEGRTIGEDAIETAGLIACETIKPISDLRSTAEYRKDVTSHAVKRSIVEALKRSKGR